MIVDIWLRTGVSVEKADEDGADLCGGKWGARNEAAGTARQCDPSAWLVRYSSGKAATASVASAFPIPAKAGYSKFPHPASRFALIGVFVAQTKAGEVRVTATGASQTGVMRVPAIEATLKANWSAGALDGVKISADGLLSDLHGSSDYRAHLIKVMTQRALAV